MSDVIRAKEIATCLECSVAVAYEIIKKLNSELVKKGYITMSGRVSRTYFEERYYLLGKTPHQSPKDVKNAGLYD